MTDARGRLRRWLALFFIALVIPTGILIRQAYSQLKWEAFHQYQIQAEALAARIDARAGELIQREEDRAFADYGFLVVTGDPGAGFVQRSPLSAYPVSTDLPGLIGYFQVDAAGAFSSPLLPASAELASRYGISANDRKARMALQRRVRRILASNRLLRDTAARKNAPGKAARVPPLAAAPAPRDSSAQAIEADALSSQSRAGVAPAAEQAAGASAFDELKKSRPQLQRKRRQLAPQSLGRVDDLKLDAPYRNKSAESTQQRRRAPLPGIQGKREARKEISTLAEAETPAPRALPEAQVPASRDLRIRTFESELDPFEFSLLDSGDMVLFRKAWRAGRRTIQGAVIERQAFIQRLFESAFRGSPLAPVSQLGLAWRGDVIAAVSGQSSQGYLTSASELSGALLYRTRLSAPLADLELLFSITRLPTGPGAGVITWAAVILALVLCGGFYLMYRLGSKQIALVEQQRDFVSAVSHELKTPLTSIRMYGEILREGWADEDKKKSYYDYIYTESERLSRLIANVLQLARMTRNDLQLNPQEIRLGELMDELRSKVASQIEHAGFEVRIELAAELAAATVTVDTDAFSQIVINLVDNAIKFSARAPQRIIDIAWRRRGDGHLVFSVRDHGPGIPRDQLRKIFRLFYRSENELTRETAGTGIGLALVRQLALAMGARVDAANRSPGAEFSLTF